MRYLSTSGKYSVDLNGAVSNCYAPDGTLYLPESLPVIPKAVFNNIEEMTLGEIAYVVVTSLLGNDVGHVKLKKVVDETFCVNIPCRSFRQNTDIFELFEGPTMAFKDFSALFAANFINLDTSASSLPKVVIVATTGNTGGAIANAFVRNKGRHTVILYPRDVLTRSQISQFTTLGPNIHAIEVAGDIGKCKRMVRDAMADETISELLRLVCVNTSNYLRIVPQVVLYFYAYSRLKAKYGSAEGFSPAIPCGNLSSLTSAVIAKRLGLPMGKIIAGCSANDDLVRVLSGQLAPERVNVTSRATLAKAMDSGYPTNLARIISLYGGDVSAAAKDIMAFSVSDAEIAEIIKHENDTSGYIVDPHTAVAIGALDKAGDSVTGKAAVFATAHPAKSLDTITEITGRAIELPLQLTKFMNRATPPVKMPPTYPALRKYLISSIN